jgi:hypothetical protein
LQNQGFIHVKPVRASPREIEFMLGVNVGNPPNPLCVSCCRQSKRGLTRTFLPKNLDNPSARETSNFKCLIEG